MGAALFLAAEGVLAWMAAPAGAGDADAPSEERPVAETWVVEGRIAKIPHAHPLQGSRAAEAFYVDTVTDGQLVAYLAKVRRPTGDGWYRFEGETLSFQTSSKRPGDTKTYAVRQLDVRTVTPLPATDRVQALVDELGRDDVSRERKEAAQLEIYEAGIAAFPVLVEHADDPRVYERGRDVQNYMGLPAHAKRPEPILADVQVGSTCRELLHRLLIPVGYRSPKERVFKPHSSRMFLVEDWRAFWRTRRSLTLPQIHEEMKPHVDRWFESGGDAQAVR